MARRTRARRLQSAFLAIAIATGVMLVSDYWLDSLSGHSTAAVRAVRGPKSERLAADLAALIQAGDERALEALLQSTLERDPELVSVGVRRTSGTLLVQTPLHARRWRVPGGGFSTTNHVLVPVYAGGEPWGNVEITYREAPPPGLTAWLRDPLVAALGAAFAASSILWLGLGLRQRAVR
jgi:hypothetical protein